ncbi:MAG: AAA family ATPase [Candidatus Adiutrix sp.]|nr:AAA family ATPase [Candidatus Adiutrix sp.]
MRVLQLKIKNLNSLAGDFTIDFTHPAYRGGVFAITGPTGAGKTTILDAICLALYGRTPRLARISKSGNEIMSRGRGECAAEVTFETPAGRWRAFWAQRRARLSADGALQDPRHEIAETGGRLLESQLSRTAARVAALTGLSFEQFTRASLLAQGAFAAFLAAPADDKAALLEQITGTTLYSDISIAVHQRRGEERRRLEELQAAGAALAGPAPGEDESDLRQRRNDLAGRLKALEENLAAEEETRARLKTLAGLEEERSRLAALEEELAGRRQAFIPLAERLGRANLALPLAPLGAELSLLREQRAKALQSLGLGGDETGEDRLKALAAESARVTRDLAEARSRRGLAALRGGLKPGRPCPLCGALEHPWGGPDQGPDETNRGALEPDELEERLDEAESLAEAKEKLGHKIKELQTALDRAAALEADISKRSGPFRLALTEAGFSGEEAWAEARLAEPRRLDLERRARKLETEAAALAAAQKDNAGRLLDAGAVNPAGRTLPEVEDLLAELAGTRRELLSALGILDHRLGELAELSARRLAWHTEAAARREEARRWEALHELIGSADGKKYRAFAQGLTFENLISQANRQLTALSDRYLLARDPAQGGLELSVVDLWQAGEVRSTKNLSGGESFLVSLALALGLARLSSRKARVDSLFLDEGFGALDEETLETVLNTLSHLNQYGRLVGVISHVPALRDRLGTQIRLLPSAGPHSRVSGPGVF